MDRLMRYTMVTAFLVLVTAALAVAPVTIRLTEAADDVLILDEDAQSVLSGTILEIEGDRMTLVNNGREVIVMLDDIDLEDTNNILAAGMAVTVYGKFEDGALEAEKVIQAGTGTL